MRRLMLLGLILLGVASCARTQSDPALMAATPPTVDVTGTVDISGTPMPRSGPISAIVQGNQLQILHPAGVTGSLTVQGDTISGELGGLSPGTITMKKVP